jgi:hypothetical protein
MPPHFSRSLTKETIGVGKSRFELQLVYAVAESGLKHQKSNQPTRIFCININVFFKVTKVTIVVNQTYYHKPLH